MTYTTLQAAIDSIQTACGGVSSVLYAPDDPPEGVAAFPFVVTYPITFTIEQGPMGMLTYLYDIGVELHVARKDLPYDIAKLMGYAQSIPNAFIGALNDNGAAQGIVTGTFGVLGWGPEEATIPTIGFRWVIQQIKIQVDLS